MDSRRWKEKSRCNSATYKENDRKITKRFADDEADDEPTKKRHFQPVYRAAGAGI